MLGTALVFVAAATAGTPKVTATVKSVSRTSHVVHIVNHDHVTYRKFVVQTLVKPVITAASKPCEVARDGNFNGTTFNWQYRAECKKSLAPGHAFDIRLTTTAQRGLFIVYVVVKGEPVRIR